MSTAEMVKAAALADSALEELRDHDAQALAEREPQLKAKLKLFTRLVAEGQPLVYELAELHQVAFDVARLRDRIRNIDEATELIDKRLRKGKR